MSNTSIKDHADCDTSLCACQFLYICDLWLAQLVYSADRLLPTFLLCASVLSHLTLYCCSSLTISLAESSAYKWYTAIEHVLSLVSYKCYINLWYSRLHFFVYKSPYIRARPAFYLDMCYIYDRRCILFHINISFHTRTSRSNYRTRKYVSMLILM